MSHGKFLGGVWYCDCEVDEEGDRKPAIKLKVNDESKESFGKYFWRCPIYKNKEETCDFFLWEDEARHRESVGRKKNQSFSGTTPITPRHSFSQDQMSTPTSFRQTQQQQLRSETFASSANRNASVAAADSDGNDDTSSMYFQPARSNFPTPSKFDFTPSKSQRNQLWRDTTPTPSVTHTINNALESFDMRSVTDEDVDHEAPTGSQATQIAPPRFGASVAITTPSKSSGLFPTQAQRHDLSPSQRQQANPNITPVKQAGRLYAAQSQSSPSEVRRNTLLIASEPNRKRPRNIDLGEEPETPSKTRMPAGQRTIKSFFGRSQADPEDSLKANLFEMIKGMRQDMRGLARDNRDTRAELRETQEQLRDHKAAMRRLEERLAVYQNGGGTGMELVRAERGASDQEEQG